MKSRDILESLLPQPDAELEWWYYSGHLTNRVHRYGFHVALFRVDLDRFEAFGKIPLPWCFARQQYVAHVGFTDIASGEYAYSLRRQGGKGVDLKRNRYSVQVADCRVEGDEDRHWIECAFNGSHLKLSLVPVKPAVLHGGHDTGSDGQPRSGHFSYSRMQVTGCLERPHGREDLTGSAWMEREFGLRPFQQGGGGWEWFAIQLDEGTEIMVELLRNRRRELMPGSTLTWIARDGAASTYSPAEFSAAAIDSWISPATGIEHPVSWRVIVPSLRLDLQTTPALPQQELDTRGVSRLVYWEGASAVEGEMAGRRVGGRAYVELVGYDGLPDACSLTGMLRDEWRIHRLGFDRLVGQVRD